MRVLPILLTGQAMASMDASILVVAAPSLRADLHASEAQLQLVVVTYTLAFAALVVAAALGRNVSARAECFYSDWRGSRWPRWRAASRRPRPT